MSRKDIVVIGASAGGMEALQKLVAGLPADLPAAVFVVWHLSPGLKTILPQVLNRAGPLPARHPEDGDRTEPGHIYVAPNDHHMLLEDGYVRITRGPKENRFRPAVDPLFRSAAYVYGPRAIGVVLSGALDDGTAGLWTIKLRGGTAIVQEPSDATVRAMPLNALEHVDADYRVPVSEMGELLGRLVREEAGAAPGLPQEEDEKTRREIRVAEGKDAFEENVAAFGIPSAFVCPECNGALTLLREGRLIRFRCHTGHAVSAGTLLSGASEKAEVKLWEAVRALDETVMILNDLGRQFAGSGDTRVAEACFARAQEAHERAQPIRALAMDNEELGIYTLRQDASG